MSGVSPSVNVVPPAPSSTNLSQDSSTTSDIYQTLQAALRAFTLDAAHSDVFEATEAHKPLEVSSASLTQLFSAMGNQSLDPEARLKCLDQAIERARNQGRPVVFPAAPRVQFVVTPRPASPTKRSQTSSKILIDVDGGGGDITNIAISRVGHGVVVSSSSGGSEVVMRDVSSSGDVGGVASDVEMRSEGYASRMEEDSTRSLSQMDTNTSDVDDSAPRAVPAPPQLLPPPINAQAPVPPPIALPSVALPPIDSPSAAFPSFARPSFTLPSVAPPSVTPPSVARGAVAQGVAAVLSRAQGVAATLSRAHVGQTAPVAGPSGSVPRVQTVPQVAAQGVASASRPVAPQAAPQASPQAAPTTTPEVPRPNLVLPTPTAARQRLEGYIRRKSENSLPGPILDRPSKGPIPRTMIDEDQVQLWPRPPPTEETRLDVAAALVVLNDFIIVQNGTERSRFSFKRTLSQLLSPTERTSRNADTSIINNAVSIAAVILARNASIYSAKRRGVSTALLKTIGKGPRVDWTEVNKVLGPCDPAVQAIPPLIDGFLNADSNSKGDKGKAYRECVTISIQEAADRIATHEAHHLVWHEKQPVSAPTRDFDDIKDHPSFALPLAKLESAVKNVLQQLEARAPGATITRMEIAHGNSPEFANLLHKALEEAKEEVDGRAPITAGIDIGEVGKANVGSVGTNVWVPFWKEYQEKEVPRLREEIRSNPSENPAYNVHFRYQGHLPGILAFSGTCDRTGANNVSLMDGQDLGAMQSFFEAAANAGTIPPLPTLYKTVDGATVPVDVPLPNNRLEEEAVEMIVGVYTKIVPLVVEFGQQGFVPPIEDFDIVGRQPFVRPAEDDHGAEGYESKSIGLRHFRSDDALVDVHFDFADNPALDISLLKLDELDLLPEETPASGESVAEAARRRQVGDTIRPWIHDAVLLSQATDLRSLIDSICKDPLFAERVGELVGLLDEASRKMSSSDGFGKRLDGKSALISIFLMKDALNIVFKEGLIGHEDLQSLWEFSILSLALSVVSTRPATFSLVVYAFIDGLNLSIDNEKDRNRLEMVLGQYQQQYCAAHLGLTYHSDSLRHFSKTDDERLDNKTYSVLTHLACRCGICPSCAKATWGLEDYHPALSSARGGDRTLSYTTLGSARSVPESVWGKKKLKNLWSESTQQQGMMPCLYELETRSMSLAARVADKHVCALTHRLDKVQRGRRSILVVVLRKALAQGQASAAQAQGTA